MAKIEDGFEKHSELEPTGKLSILGEPHCSPDRMLAYARRRNPDAPDIAEMYWRQGKRYGVRGDVAYCQAAYDTRFWTTEFAGPDWAPMVRAMWADEAAIGERIRMLYTFATEAPLDSGTNAEARSVELIEWMGWKGRAPCWEDLNGKWSQPGNLRYGQDIAAMWRGMREWRGPSGDASTPANRPVPVRPIRPVDRFAGSVEWTATYSGEQLNWLQNRRLLPMPAPHPDRKVTWAELAVLLREWEIRLSEDRGQQSS